jgi:hypothetical protein
LRADKSSLAEGLDVKNGSTLLFPDRLVHVSHGRAGIALGLIRYVVARRATEKRAHEGVIGVWHIPLSAITGVRFTRTANGKNGIELDTFSGLQPRLGVSFEAWTQPVRDAIVATRRETADVAGGFRVT